MTLRVKQGEEWGDGGLRAWRKLKWEKKDKWDSWWRNTERWCLLHASSGPAGSVVRFTKRVLLQILVWELVTFFIFSFLRILFLNPNSFFLCVWITCLFSSYGRVFDSRSHRGPCKWQKCIRLHIATWKWLSLWAVTLATCKEGKIPRYIAELPFLTHIKQLVWKSSTFKSVIDLASNLIRGT